MRRHLFTIIAASSALIALLATALWIRSFSTSDVWASHLHTPATRTLASQSFEAADGWLLRVRSTVLLPPGTVPQPPPPMDSTWIHAAGPARTSSNVPPDTNWSFIIRHRANTTPRPSTPRSFHVTAHTVTGVRLLPVALLSSILPALWVTRLLRARHANTPGSCPSCGYDLRASPERCPECGTVRGSLADVSNGPGAKLQPVGSIEE